MIQSGVVESGVGQSGVGQSGVGWVRVERSLVGQIGEEWGGSEWFGLFHGLVHLIMSSLFPLQI